MATHHCGGTAQTLYRVFVLPNFSKSPLLGRQSHLPQPTGPRSLREIRAFSTTHARQAKPRPAPRTPEVRTEKWNEEIKSKIVYLIDAETNNLLPETYTRFDLLNKLNRDTHRLVQFSEERHGLPVCKIVSKKEEYERGRQRKQQAKERKKQGMTAKSLKTLELNWAMDQHDLAHRLNKMTEFLSEGRKVEIILASKKKGRKASPEECEDVLYKIRQTADAVNGAKEEMQMEGKLGGFATLAFSGRPAAQQSSQTPG